jgi:hypothetical protein
MTAPVNFDHLPYWQQQLLSAINSLVDAIVERPFEKSSFSKKNIWALRPILPYVIHETGIQGKYIVLNRDYRPIGIHYDRMVDYKNFPFMHINQSELPLFSESYEHKQSNQIDGRFFNDSCAPWSSRKNAEVLLKRYKHLLHRLQGV